jgi:hypothetical protein
VTGIPSDIAGSAAQAGYQAREATRTRDAQREGQSLTAKDHSRAVDESSAVIDTSDEGTSVYADAEGTGGQGRHFEGEERENTTEPDGQEDASEQGGLDIRA